LVVDAAEDEADVAETVAVDAPGSVDAPGPPLIAGTSRSGHFDGPVTGLPVYGLQPGSFAIGAMTFSSTTGARVQPLDFLVSREARKGGQPETHISGG
jgi:hypothetical protein